MSNVGEFDTGHLSVAFVLSSHIDTPAAASLRETAPVFDDRSADPAHLTAYSTLVVDIDLSQPETVQRTRQLLAGLTHRPRLVFAVDRGPRRHQQTVQANALGAKALVPRPAGLAAIRALDEGAPAVAAREAPPPDAPSAHPSVQSGARMLSASFAALAAGAPLDVKEAVDASRELLIDIGQGDLHSWLDTVRAHHTGTFQHCLLVTGAAAAFANYTRMPEQTRVQFTMAALLHDIGKAEIPNSILDKPSKLTTEEFAVIQKHPGIGAEYLKRQGHVPAVVIDAVLQHHEYLDGSGYPHGVKADSITPLARILTICDVYGAMVEHRSYKTAKTPAEALYVLISMAQAGKVDFRIVRTFADAIGTVLPSAEPATRVAATA